MKLKYLVLGLFLFSSFAYAQDAADDTSSAGGGDKSTSYTADLNEDGTVKQRTLSSKEAQKEQEEDIKMLDEQIKDYQAKLQKLIPYIKKFKPHRIKDNKYVQDTDSYRDFRPGSRYRYVVNQFFTVNMEDNSVAFTERSGRLGATYERVLRIREISAKGSGESVKLKITTFTPDAQKPKVAEFDAKNIIEPEQRISVLREYRKKLEHAVRTLDKIVEGGIHRNYINVVNSIKNINE